ncbi:hypothetical protein PIB30_067305 [Stylosanthes scabra]|uniref:Uncharacterized protein n=1 Tax=Stylosanthes scabra TaxID=79078 RepID=A0ABU6XNZ6_9FABA|nr:hypothetical protein [Stylosanthes scabra]
MVEYNWTKMRDQLRCINAFGSGIGCIRKTLNDANASHCYHSLQVKWKDDRAIEVVLEWKLRVQMHQWN